jgi:PAS domain S-box-containing protein
MAEPSPRPRWTPWVPLLYLTFGVVWILASDFVVGWFFRDSPHLQLVAGTLKGFAFVFLTALVLAIWWRMERRRNAALVATAQAQADFATQRMAWMSRHANEAMLLVDDQGRIIDCNERAEAIYGRTRAELLTLHKFDLRMPADRASAQDDLQRILRDGNRVIDSQHVRRDGSTFPAEVSLRRIDFEERQYVQAIVRDQTELVAARRRLEETVASRTQELTVARDRAEQADRAKTAFLSTISHELRTPLNSIIGFTEIVLGGLSGPLNDEQRKQLGIVHESSRLLLGLINEMLDLSRIEAGRLQFNIEPFDLGELLRMQADALRPQCAEKGLELLCDIAPEVGAVVSDPKRVAQIVVNLLANAIKFTPAGGVALFAHAHDAHVEIAVHDTGPGIPEEEMAHLFKPFMQGGDAQRSHREGAGLGLAIARHLARALGGDIVVHSHPGAGARFLVTLPLASPVIAEASGNTGLYRKMAVADPRTAAVS